MSMRTQIVHGLRSLFRREAGDDLADEIDHYLAELAASYRAQGLSDEDALRAPRDRLHPSRSAAPSTGLRVVPNP